MRAGGKEWFVLVWAEGVGGAGALCQESGRDSVRMLGLASCGTESKERDSR